MDPLTQGVVGAMAAQCSTRQSLGKAAIIGALAGMAADLDILIRSSHDPLLALEFHRHFTHSLIFIPVAACLLAALIYPLQRRHWQLPFAQLWLWVFLGYATHGLLDACTSYGTQLLWPFSNYRVAWDVVSVIDPLFTLPLLAMVILCVRRQNRRWLTLACGWATVYLILGSVQHHRALQMGEQMASARGHQPQRMEAKPSFANLAVWKVLYRHQNTYYVVAVKPGLFNSHSWGGEAATALDIATQLPGLDPDSQQAADIERFRWFSAGFIAQDPDNPYRIVDVRYSMLPDEIKPLWGINLDPNAPPDQHADYQPSRREGAESLPRLWQMIWE